MTDKTANHHSVYGSGQEIGHRFSHISTDKTEKGEQKDDSPEKRCSEARPRADFPHPRTGAVAFFSGVKDLIVGVDLGGTHFRVMLAHHKGQKLEHCRYTTRAFEGPQVVVERVVGAVLNILSGYPKSRVLGVGVAAPGPMDPQSGVLYSPPNLPGWDNMPLRDILQNRLALPVWAGNDANLAALGEHSFGRGQGVDDLVYLTISTGIGGGFICGGELLLGHHGLTAEVGHMQLETDGPLCGCGKRGCLEALASGTSIARAATARLRAGEPSLLQGSLSDDSSLLTAEQVVESARQGDKLAGDVLQRAATYVGTAIATLIHLLDPAMVVIGGGVSNAGDLLFVPVRQAVEAHTMTIYHGRVQILPTALGDNAGLWGAVALVLGQGASPATTATAL